MASLFTHISMQLLTNSISKEWTKVFIYININLENIFIFNSSIFNFNNIFYNQGFDTLGSPLNLILISCIVDS